MKKTILVVDDNPEIRDILGNQILAPLGFRWVPARNGKEGLELAIQHNPDLILLDVNMPGMDGFEMLAALQQTLVQAPVILITADADVSVTVQAIRQGVSDYIPKPFTPEEVRDAINRSLERVRLRAEKNRLTQQLIEADAVRKTAITLAHRINNALMTLGGSLYLLLETAEQEHYSPQALQRIQEGLNSAREIANVLKVLQETVEVKTTPYLEDAMMVEITLEGADAGRKTPA